jgi:putative N-acetyltransferase (TIGR04045 family)
MILEPFKPFIASEFQVKFATESWERRGAFALRRDVFCTEQGLFEGDDIDAIDAHAIPLVALSMLGVAADAVVGTVRIHEAEAGQWWGSRLAVAPGYRKVGALGAALIRLAVSSAHARGCRRFLANVQVQNVLLFRRLHWQTIDEIELVGRAHHLMMANLDYYRPFEKAEQGFVALARRAA